ncbi:MAG: preprotein translocase subunit YajC [Desulfobacterales bacterium]|nr:preprotein translocase subunit YajC [Desulfobacterales bacterium]
MMVGDLSCIFYFLMIRPQQKKQKELKAMLDNLAHGDIGHDHRRHSRQGNRL